MNSEGGSDSESLVFDYNDDDGSCIRPRKRQRLTHLTPGEKLQRRKLKNRVAAQAARDRKKAYMDELEEMVAQLQSDNKRLAQENTVLRQQQRCTNCHNNKKSIPESSTVKAEPMSSIISTLTEPEATSKSAEGTASGLVGIDDDLMLPDLSQELQQLCEYLQQDTISDGTAGFDTENSPHTGSSSYIPTVVGTTAERMESDRDSLSRDHLYHKVIEPTVVTAVLNNNTKQLDIVKSSPQVIHKVVSTSVNDSPVISPIPSPHSSESMFMDNDCSLDLGSDGNRSPYSDISVNLSPGSPDELGLDWNDSFVDLFPQLSA